MGHSQTRRVAVIAVHGVADQKPGDTAEAIAALLIASPAAQAAYRLDASDEIGLHVDSLPPTHEARQACVAAQARQPATPDSPRSLPKAFAQSMRSDLHRRDWVVDPAQPMSEAPPPAPMPPGIELTDFLLFKALRNETPPAVYETTRLELVREGPAPQQVDVYEMYWADLSRLAGSVPRILTELFTLLFRLSQLGRDTVAAASRQFDSAETFKRRWRVFSAAQTGLDWAFSKGLALLTLQLLMMAFIIVPVGLALTRPGFAEEARRVLAFALPALALLWFLYRFEKSPRVWLLGAAGLAALCLLLARPPAHWVVGGVWLVLLSLAYDAVMRVCDARFPATRFVGWIFWSAVLAVVLASAAALELIGVPGLDAEQGLRIFTFGALRAVECILVATVLWWGAAGLGLVLWLAFGQACAWTNGFEGRASVATGRLGLFISMSFFIVLAMAGWAALTPVLDMSVAGQHYVPLVFRDEQRAVVDAASFLDTRYEYSTETFSLIVLLLLALLAHLVVGFFPSVLAEMKVLKTRATRLGRWLTMAYRALDFVVAGIVVCAVLAALLVGLALNSRWFGTTWITLLNDSFPQIPRWSQDFLKPLIWTAASATVALSVLGGVLSRYVPWLRAPLDVALDVDSHFREFPRRAIPRARIFSRFAALLQHVSTQGYERIVIVAHSQGTVITTELLRYLKYRAELPACDGDAATALWQRLAGRLHLLTAGSPLRQIYAARFPSLYRWVLREDTALMGPTAAGLGVERWVNAYTTGDYVGRWLWSRKPQGDLSEPMIDEVVRPHDVYESTAGPDTLLAAARQRDVCLGAGAHTHYFETSQHGVASLIDQLITAPWPKAQDANEPLQPPLRVGARAAAL